MMLCRNPSCDRTWRDMGTRRVYCSRTCQVAANVRPGGEIVLTIELPARVWHRLNDLDEVDTVEAIAYAVLADEVGL